MNCAEILGAAVIGGFLLGLLVGLVGGMYAEDTYDVIKRKDFVKRQRRRKTGK